MFSGRSRIMYHSLLNKSNLYANAFIKLPDHLQYKPTLLTSKPKFTQYSKTHLPVCTTKLMVQPVNNVMDWGFFFPKINPFRKKPTQPYNNNLELNSALGLKRRTPNLNHKNLKPLFKRRRRKSLYRLPTYCRKLELRVPVTEYKGLLKDRRPLVRNPKWWKPWARRGLVNPNAKRLKFNFLLKKNPIVFSAYKDHLPSLFSVVPRRSSKYEDVGLTKIEMVRFKPGLLVQWKELRLHFARLSKLKANSHAKITRFVVLQKATTGFAFIKTLALSAFFLLKQASLFDNPFTLRGWTFKATRSTCWLLNGEQLTNNLTQIYPGDVLTTPTLKFKAEEFSALRNWSQVRFFRRWKFYQRKVSFLASPTYLEIDELTQTVVLLFNPTKLSQLDPSIWSARPFLTHRMLNWKRLT